MRDIAAVEPWRLPLPAEGASLRLASGARWRHGLAHTDPAGLARALAAAGAVLVPAAGGSPPAAYAQARASIRRGRLDHPLLKFVLFPLVLAIPAFRLHQHIAYGGTFGEAQTFGLAAYATTFVIWWAAWVIGVVLVAAVLRAAIEVGTWAAVLVRGERAADVRRWLERLALAALYLGLPAWLLVRVLLS